MNDMGNIRYFETLYQEIGDIQCQLKNIEYTSIEKPVLKNKLIDIKNLL